MSHHGHEDEVELCGEECRHWRAQLYAAVATLQAIAKIDAIEDYRTTRSRTAIKYANEWLEANGYEGGEKIRERARRNERAAELDREIERLRAEKAALK